MNVFFVDGPLAGRVWTMGDSMMRSVSYPCHDVDEVFDMLAGESEVAGHIVYEMERLNVSPTGREAVQVVVGKSEAGGTDWANDRERWMVLFWGLCHLEETLMHLREMLSHLALNGVSELEAGPDDMSDEQVQRAAFEVFRVVGLKFYKSVGSLVYACVTCPKSGEFWPFEIEER